MNKIIDSIKNSKLVDMIKDIISNMILYLNKFIDKVGKVNFILLVFVIGVITVVGLYTTLAADTSDNYSLVAKTYRFIIGDKDGGEVIVAAGEGKYIDITVSNPEKIDMKYALYYNSSDIDFEIGYIKETVYPTSGVVKANSEVVVSIYVRNNSTSDVTIELGVDYGTVNGGDISVSGTRIENEISPYDLLSDYVIDLYNNGSAINTVNIGGDTSNPTVSLNANEGLMLDNNGVYRYYGASPDNYVWYNDELWRIISVSYEDDGTGSYSKRVKIIKDEILEDDNGLNAFSWDSSDSTINSGYGVNDWTQADLMTELNSLYYNSTSGTCYTGSSNATTACDFTNSGLSEEAKNLTGDAVYYLGGNSTYDGLYADDYYTFERGTTVYDCSTDDGACPRATTWTGSVGIMYPSDYMYATDLRVCVSNGYWYDSTGCYNNDWLFSSNSSQWTIFPYTTSGYYGFRIDVDTTPGELDPNASYMSLALSVRPVVYLNTNVIVTSGNGTSSSPYQIELFNHEVDSGNVYTISYDANGGSGAPSSQIKFEGSSLTLSSTIPTRDGYTFVGWATSADATSATYQGGDTYTTDESITLYAVWLSTTLVTGPTLRDTISTDATSIIFTDAVASSGTTLTDVSSAGDGGVVMWNSGTTYYISTQRDGIEVMANQDSSFMFSLKTYLTSIDFTNLNTSNVTSMQAFFNNVGYDTTTMVTLTGFSDLDTSKVTNMDHMFSQVGYNASSAISLDISGLEVDSVTNMSYMFYGVGYNAPSVTLTGFTNWNTSEVTSMESMFSSIGRQSSTVTVNELANLNTSSVTNMLSMFMAIGQYSTSFSIGNLSGWNTSSATDMSYMFYNAGYSATWSLDCSSWNVNEVTAYSGFNKNVTAKVTAPTWVN